VGVELGQFAALAVILIAFDVWCTSGTFLRSAYVTNALIMMAGFTLLVISSPVTSLRRTLSYFPAQKSDTSPR